MYAIHVNGHDLIEFSQKIDAICNDKKDFVLLDVERFIIRMWELQKILKICWKISNIFLGFTRTSSHGVLFKNQLFWS